MQGLWDSTYSSNQKVQFLGIEVWDGTKKQIEDNYKRLSGAKYPLLVGGGDAQIDYKATHNIFIVDKDGIVRYKSPTHTFIYENVVGSLDSAIVKPRSLPPSEAKFSSELKLGQNFPNPFNPSTSFNISAPVGENVDVSVFSLKGELVTSIWKGTAPNESKRLHWNAETRSGRPLPSGTYFIRMSSRSGQYEQRSVTLIR